jgi:MFS family permease
MRRMNDRWLILAVLTFARTAMGFQFQSVAAVSPFLLDYFQMSYALLGTVVGLYLFPGAAVALPGGVLAQRYGDRFIVCIGLAAMTSGAVLMGVSGNYAVLIGGRVICGCGAVLLNVLVTKMVTDWFQGREIVTALGILISSWPLGIAAALVVLPMLAQTTSWSMAMYATAALSAVAWLLVVAFYRSPADVGTSPALRLNILLSRREFALAILSGWVWTFYNIGFIIVLAFGPDFMIASGHGALAASAMVSTVSWIIIPAIPIGAWLAERIGRPDLMMLGCFLLAAVAIWSLATIGPSLVLLAMIGVIFGPPGGLIMALPGEAAPPARRAVTMGIYFTCYYVGMGVLPPIAGYARDLSGSAAAPLWLAGAMAILAGLCFIQFRLVQSRKPQTA